MLRVGLTGGIAAGKSVVAGRLAELGAVVVDYDVLARDVVAPGTTGLASVVEAFGPGVVAPDGGLDREALAGVVFADAAALARLNAIVHPLVRREAAQREADAAAAGRSVVVHDVPLLVETGDPAAFDALVVVEAPADVRLERLVAERSMTPEQARARMAAQASDAERRAAASVLLDGSGTVDGLRAQVDALWRSWVRTAVEEAPAQGADDVEEGRPEQGAAPSPPDVVPVTVLVTGFEPFGGRTVNASWEAVERLGRLWAGPERVVVERLPVAFGAGPARLRELVTRLRPAFVLGVGEAGGRRVVSLERVALNLADARIPDTTGAAPVDEPVVAGGPTAYLASLPVKACAAAARATGVPTEVSHTAGTYVCNATFYALLHHLEALDGVRGGFVHVPVELDDGTDPDDDAQRLALALAAVVRTALDVGVDLRTTAGTLD